MRGKKNTTPEEIENARLLKIERHKRWRMNNPNAAAVIKRNRRANYLRHKPEIQAKVEEWQKANPEKVKKYCKKANKKYRRKKKQAKKDAIVAKRKFEASTDGRFLIATEIDTQLKRDRAKELAEYKAKPVWTPGANSKAKEKKAGS